MRFSRSPLPSRLAGHAMVAGALCIFGLIVAAASRLPAQNASPAPSAAGNLFGADGGFEKISGTDEVLWDGVASTGVLTVPAYSALVATERSAYAPVPMPPSVAVADLNGDGKPDLLVASPNGYFFFYPNSGTATQPRFTGAELVPIYLSTSFRVRERYFDRDVLDSVRFCPRISLADWRGRGVPDLLVGNYMGELYLVPNEGSTQRASFRQPASLDAARVPTDDKGRLWGNLLSPAACDWRGTGKLDLLLGEGTYSANSIRLLENLGGSTPKFFEPKSTYLAYGDGREQLIPTVADYNGDGKPDLIVADRNREIGVYLNTGAKDLTESIPRASTISFGGTSKLPGFAAPCAVDFNGDGLFDLVMGLDSGRIAVALNQGTPGQPKFGAVQELKGQDRIGKVLKRPNGWALRTYAEYGNAMGYFSVVNAADDPASAPPEGANCLKAGYWPVANTVFPMDAQGIPGTLRKFAVSRTRITLEAGKNYTLSFKVKGSGMEKLHYSFYSRFNDFIGAVKQELDDRQRSRAVGQRVAETIEAGGDFSASGNWTTVNKTINVRYKKSELQSLKEITGDIEVEFWSRSMSDVLYLDDFQLVQAK